MVFQEDGMSFVSSSVIKFTKVRRRRVGRKRIDVRALGDGGDGKEGGKGRKRLIKDISRLVGPIFGFPVTNPLPSVLLESNLEGNEEEDEEEKRARQRRDLRRILPLFWTLSKPYWREDKNAKWRLGGVGLLALLQSGISVGFSYIGRDLWNALSAKEPDK